MLTVRVGVSRGVQVNRVNRINRVSWSLSERFAALLFERAAVIISSGSQQGNGHQCLRSDTCISLRLISRGSHCGSAVHATWGLVPEGMAAGTAGKQASWAGWGVDLPVLERGRRPAGKRGWEYLLESTAAPAHPGTSALGSS